MPKTFSVGQPGFYRRQKKSIPGEWLPPSPFDFAQGYGGQAVRERPVQIWASGSVVERLPDKKEVQGSIPCSPTILTKKCVRGGRRLDPSLTHSLENLEQNVFFRL